MKSRAPQTLLEAVRYFADPEVCRWTVAECRWPHGVTCPRPECRSKAVWFIRTRGIWRCKKCRKQFSAKVGSIFEDSPLGLDKWLPGVWLLSSSKKSVSSYQFAKALGVTQKTAWFMLHRIRLAMRNGSLDAPLSGEVDVDETFPGGKERNKHKSKRLHRGTGPVGKAAVLGLLARHGEVRAHVIPDIRKGTLQAEVRRNVAPGATVYSDALRSYDGLDGEYVQEVINHAEEFVRGKVHTNSIENFWSLFKRTIYGTHHFVMPDHLDRYLDDATFRFNTRKLSNGERFALTVAGADGGRLTYRELTSKEGVAPCPN